MKLKNSNMELLNGLPHKTITATDKQGTEHIFGVTTDAVNDLILEHYQLISESSFKDLKNEGLDYFDSKYMYAVPQNIFEMEDEYILSYINENIDDNFKTNLV